MSNWAATSSRFVEIQKKNSVWKQPLQFNEIILSTACQSTIPTTIEKVSPPPTAGVLLRRVGSKAQGLRVGTYVCGSSKLNAYSCLPEWMVWRPSSELSSSRRERQKEKKKHTLLHLSTFLYVVQVSLPEPEGFTHLLQHLRTWCHRNKGLWSLHTNCSMQRQTSPTKG